MFKPIIISAPFGNWLQFQGCTPTLGTFTYRRRGGLLYRAWRCLLTLRYMRRPQGYINKLGLPNPGISHLMVHHVGYCSDKMVSIHGSNHEEWMRMAIRCAEIYGAMAVELNLSCPNVHVPRNMMFDLKWAVEYLVRNKVPVIAKLPPVKWLRYAQAMFDMGVTVFHCCNTIPTPGGGISGKPLKQFSIWACEELRTRWPVGIRIIGGGGVSSPEDVHDYLAAGAHYVAIGSMLLNPLNWRKVPSLVWAAEHPRYNSECEVRP